MKFLFLTGISGAGRTQAAKFLEDLGYFCIDNMPAPLLTKFKEFFLINETKTNKIAFVIDIRNGDFVDEFIGFVKALNDEGVIHTEVLFMDCSDEKILKRYKELKRLHPWARDGVDNKTAIEMERKSIAPVKLISDYIIDTTEMSIWNLKNEMFQIFGADRKQSGIKTEIISFGFKNGIPATCDIVFDVRFIPNPYYVQKLKMKTGLDSEVRDFVMSGDAAETFLARFFDIIKMLLPLYQNEGKELIVIGIGCTGGQHRSVAIAEELGKRISSLGYSVAVSHRDISKDILNKH